VRKKEITLSLKELSNYLILEERVQKGPFLPILLGG